jgi:hypothetical protein
MVPKVEGYELIMIPVISIDPNGPWHQNPDDPKDVWLVTNVSEPDMIDSIRRGEIKPGDRVIEFQPNSENGQDREYGWATIGIFRKWHDCSEKNQDLGILVYLGRDKDAKK